MPVGTTFENDSNFENMYMKRGRIEYLTNGYVIYPMCTYLCANDDTNMQGGENRQKLEKVLENSDSKNI